MCLSLYTLHKRWTCAFPRSLICRLQIFLLSKSIFIHFYLIFIYLIFQFYFPCSFFPDCIRGACLQQRLAKWGDELKDKAALCDETLYIKLSSKAAVCSKRGKTPCRSHATGYAARSVHVRFSSFHPISHQAPPPDLNHPCSTR